MVLKQTTMFFVLMAHGVFAMEPIGDVKECRGVKFIQDRDGQPVLVSFSPAMQTQDFLKREGLGDVLSWPAKFILGNPDGVPESMRKGQDQDVLKDISKRLAGFSFNDAKYCREFRAWSPEHAGASGKELFRGLFWADVDTAILYPAGKQPADESVPCDGLCLLGGKDRTIFAGLSEWARTGGGGRVGLSPRFLKVHSDGFEACKKGSDFLFYDAVANNPFAGVIGKDVRVAGIVEKTDGVVWIVLSTGHIAEYDTAKDAWTELGKSAETPVVSVMKSGQGIRLFSMNDGHLVSAQTSDGKVFSKSDEKLVLEDGCRLVVVTGNGETLWAIATADASGKDAACRIYRRRMASGGWDKIEDVPVEEGMKNACIDAIAVKKAGKDVLYVAVSNREKQTTKVYMTK